jgi:hypothetical protein
MPVYYLVQWLYGFYLLIFTVIEAVVGSQCYVVLIISE